MTTITPPPVPPLPPQVDRPQEAAPSGRPHPAATVIAVLAIVLGALIVAGAATGAIVGGIAAASVRTDTRTVTAAGLGDLDLDVSAGDVSVEYGDVAEITLDVTSTLGADAWTFERDGETLRVRTPDGFLGLAWVFGGNGSAVITLPSALETQLLDADLNLSAGSLTAAGTFGTLDATVSAGSLEVDGAVSSLATDVSAGSAQLELASVDDAQLSVSAGELVAEFTGTAPRSVALDLSAGSLELTVPDEVYDVQVDVSAGELRNHLDTSVGSGHQITGQISAGDAVLRAGS
ncbi:DUF4097 family beta strand repeat-containing protein [Microbacterium fluvii]|uniref:DUF4097 family beta strand repeat-containing protein n=1 Tax=Microbacterium fluvii TaxID=415215 RepID=A0ABW2HDZ6_9MICO|nr:DUF4097 family beta strand repeat-containing protein [Microbacterium fluvii]MCU4672972.1 DUF4097 family beta strand repeat-containing protein [Microbacterium fluvii]